MAGKPLHELRRAAAQSRAVPADKVNVVKPPVEKTAAVPEKSLDDILSDAKMRAVRGEENEDILAMVKSLKGMLHGD